MTTSLFQPYTLGRLTLKNRVVMAPMTRSRSLGNVPGDIVATYYQQRATAGLIITEGTAPDAHGTGYARIPGIYTDAQLAGWRAVADAVHAEGGAVFMQLMHTGRASAEANLPAGARILGASDVPLTEKIWTDAAGEQPAGAPSPMTESDIETALQGFEDAAANAIAAGLDGVELHGANGYLIDQFLNTASNTRTDGWGGTIQGRLRFAVEAARRTAARIGADRVGMRISPYGVFNGMVPDADTDALYVALAEALSEIGIAYLHVVDHSAMGAPAVPEAIKSALRTAFRGTYILSGGYDRARAEADLDAGRGDLVAFGRPFLANPTLVAKLEANEALAQPDFTKLYTPGADGYIDYV